MNLSRIFILRPIATTLAMVAIFLFGMIGYRSLPMAALPEVDYPTIQVVTLYPGASPEVITAMVTAPLERQFGQMSGLKQMSSQSSGGASVITLQFGLDLDLDVAEQEVQAAINTASNLLPADLPSAPIYNKVNPADPPIITLAVSSNSLAMTRVQDLVDTRIAQRMSQVTGVGLVALSGGQRPAVRINLNPQALAASGLSSEQVRNRVTVMNTNSPKGGFDGESRSLSISANDQLQTAEEYGDIILAYSNGGAVRLRDVAEIVQGAENDKLAAWANRSPAIIINVQRQPGANVIETVDRILAQLPSIQEGLPADLTVQVLTDRTETIRASVKDVQFELMLAIVLVVMVIFVFLRNWRATIIPGVAVPLSLIGTFAIMYLAGYSLNNLTLMALTIATGFVVDDAIVVVENISRYLEQGESPLNAALKGAGEIGFTIISLTISLVAVLIPLLFMGDVVGRLFREFAVTLAVAILISGFISLTLTPMMSARLLREGHTHSSGRFGQWSEGLFERLINTYERSLSWVLQRQKQTLLVAFATLVLTLLLFYVIPKGFFPQQDNGVIQGITRASPDISFRAMATRQQEAVDKILQDPDVRSVSSFIGVDGTNASLNSGRLQINLKPLSERSARAPEIIQRLQQRVALIPGFDIFMQPIQDLTIETTVSPTQYQFTVQAQNTDQLKQWVPRLVTRLQQEKWLQDVATDMQTNAAVAYLNIDRDMLGRLGLSVADVSNVLYNAYGQRMISTIFTQTSQYRVVLGVDSKLAANLEGLQALSLTTAKGEVVPLLSVVSVEERRGNLVVSHLDQFPAATVSFNLAAGVALGDAVELIETIKQELGLPADMLTTFQGSALAFKASLSNQVWLMIAAVVCMYIVLGILYESLIHPVTILSTLPSAGVGALLALMMGGKELSVIAIIGIILLIGIVKKNAIMMIDFALAAEREQGLKPFDAIYQACLLRFRPILMTTMAALLGAVPLMLSTGVGAELRQPLGIAMVGGLILSQILTLYTTPVIYLMFDRLATRWRQRGTKDA